MPRDANGAGALVERADLDALKARVNLAEALRAGGVELRRVGRNLVGCCPFHEDSEASLVVNPAWNHWNCFGCQAGGDILTFVQLREGLVFPEALERVRALADLAPAAPRRRTRVRRGAPESAAGPAEALPGSQPEVLPGGLARGELLGRVADLYHQSLRESPEARRFLADRGLGDPELWSAFRLGFADGRLLDTLPPEGEVREALEALGVLNSRESEHLAGCLVVPLDHPDQGVVGLYGRRLDPEAQVRHLFLSGPRRGVLNWQALRRSEKVLLAEGALDALALWAAGQRTATALHGTPGLPGDLEDLLGRSGVRGPTDRARCGRRGRAPARRPGRQGPKRLAFFPLTDREVVRVGFGRQFVSRIGEAVAYPSQELAHLPAGLLRIASGAAFREEASGLHFRNHVCDCVEEELIQ